MEFYGKHRLVPHPLFRPSSRFEIEVTVAKSTSFDLLELTYIVSPATSVMFADQRIGHLPNLWKSTCFELFLRPKTGGYDEYNFAPVAAWDAYRFTDWRVGMRPLKMSAHPLIVDSRVDDRRRNFPERYELDVIVGADVLPALGGKANLAAVIEEKNGTKSYWALAHPDGPPDFHDPACFVAQLPAIAGR